MFDAEWRTTQERVLAEEAEEEVHPQTTSCGLSTVCLLLVVVVVLVKDFFLLLREDCVEREG